MTLQGGAFLLSKGVDMEEIQKVKTKQIISLKERLDIIDEQTASAAYGGYYQSRLCILLSEWEKGEVTA